MFLDSWVLFLSPSEFLRTHRSQNRKALQSQSESRSELWSNLRDFSWRFNSTGCVPEKRKIEWRHLKFEDRIRQICHWYVMISNNFTLQQFPYSVPGFGSSKKKLPAKYATSSGSCVWGCGIAVGLRCLLNMFFMLRITHITNADPNANLRVWRQLCARHTVAVPQRWQIRVDGRQRPGLSMSFIFAEDLRSHRAWIGRAETRLQTESMVTCNPQLNAMISKTTEDRVINGYKWYKWW